MLAVKELLGSKLKFGLIALAIGLVVSLTMSMSAMSEGLIAGMTGAKRSLEADALVFQGDTDIALERSVLSAEDLDTIAAADGVKESYGVGHAIVTVDSAAEEFDARVFGLQDRFDQLPVVEGEGVPGPGEAIVDIAAANDGVALGDTLHLTPVDRELTVVGFTEGRRYVMAPAIYVDMDTWESIYIDSALGRMTSAAQASTEADSAQADPAAAERVSDRIAASMSGGASIAAVQLESGTTIEQLADTLGEDFDVVTPAEAALAGNGMAVMVLAVDGIQWVSLVIGALVVGVFFYITTLQKSGQIAAVKALGASDAYMGRQLFLQVTILVSVAAVFGTLLALGTAASMPPDMAIEPEAQAWALTLVSVYIAAYVGSLFSLVAILRIDPASALNSRSDS